MINKKYIDFLKSLPVDGSYRVLNKGELELATELHLNKKCFLVTGLDLQNLVCLTFEGHKLLAHEDW